MLTPVTDPVARPTVAFVVLPLIQVPPDDVLDSVASEPTHTTCSPVMAGGAEFTVTTAVRAHELDNVYVIVVVPVATGDIDPAVEIVATPCVLLDHVPPVGEDERVVVPAGHSARIPLIAAGILFTVTSAVALHPVESV